MARAIWSGSISFGMVSIPVKLFGATESRDITFPARDAKVINLADALKRSLEAARKGSKAKSRRTRKVG